MLSIAYPCVRTLSNSTIKSFSRTIVAAVNLGIPFDRTRRNTSRSGKSASSTFPNPVECGYRRFPIFDVIRTACWLSTVSITSTSPPSSTPRFTVSRQLAASFSIAGRAARNSRCSNPLSRGSSNNFRDTRATVSPITNDFGQTWLSGNPQTGVSPLTNPFPTRADGTRFDAPVGAAQGLLARTGAGWGFFGENVPRARQHRWRIDLQRQLGSNMVASVGYAATYSDQIRLARRLDSLPGQFWNTTAVRNAALATNLNQNVTNPFRVQNFSDLQASNPIQYQALASRGYFTSATIPKHMLLRPFSQMNNISDSSSTDGKVKTHSIEASFQRRFSRGFTFNANYTALYERDQLYYHNEFDPLPTWRQSNAGVPQRFAATGIFELPFGRGRAYARSGVSSALLGGWQVAGTYEWQPGALLDWGNLYYYGDLADINTGTRTLDRWFNTDNFERNSQRTPAAFQARVFPTRVNGVRGDGLNRIDANIQRDFRLRESLTLQFRMDALNAANRSQFENPNLDPLSTNFGRVTNNTSSTMRFLLFQVRLKF